MSDPVLASGPLDVAATLVSDPVLVSGSLDVADTLVSDPVLVSGPLDVAVLVDAATEVVKERVDGRGGAQDHGRQLGQLPASRKRGHSIITPNLKIYMQYVNLNAQRSLNPNNVVCEISC